MQTDIPKAVGTLDRVEGFGHFFEHFEIFGSMWCIFGHHIQRTHEGSIHPTIAARPIAIFTVRLFVGSDEIFIAPPEFVLWIIQPFAAVLIFSEIIHGVHFFKIAIVVVQHSKFCHHRHSHLQRIYPRPMIIAIIG